jgi:hypothetical protein
VYRATSKGRTEDGGARGKGAWFRRELVDCKPLEIGCQREALWRPGLSRGTERTVCLAGERSGGTEVVDPCAGETGLGR